MGNQSLNRAFADTYGIQPDTLFDLEPLYQPLDISGLEVPVATQDIARLENMFALIEEEQLSLHYIAQNADGGAAEAFAVIEEHWDVSSGRPVRILEAQSWRFSCPQDALDDLIAMQQACDADVEDEMSFT